MKIVYFLRSIICDLLMYSLMIVIGLLCMPFSLWSRKNTYKSIRFYCKSVFFVLRYVAGITLEIRGKIPTEPCLICSKHQSFLDILMLVSVVPDCRFIMKHQLVNLPLIGFYARQIGCVAVNRDKKVGTVSKMLAGLQKEEGRQTIIYPQGTRVLPGEKKEYRMGAALIYRDLGLPCYLVATNTGNFWARRSPYRYPGKAVIEFVDVLAEGMEINKFIKVVERKIEARSDSLMSDLSKR